MNAIAHAMEAFYAPDRNPVIELMGKDAMAAFRDSLPRLIANPQDRAARAQALYAAWCCSTALGYVSMALHHKLAHVFGGSFDTPHAETHAILLPYTTAFNESVVPDLLRPVAEAFGGDSAGGGALGFCTVRRLSAKPQGHWREGGGPRPRDGDRGEERLRQSPADRAGIDKGTPPGGMGCTPTCGLRTDNKKTGRTSA